MIKFRCSNCDQLLDASDEMIRERVSCPECEQVNVVPETSTVSELTAGLEPMVVSGTPRATEPASPTREAAGQPADLRSRTARHAKPEPPSETPEEGKQS